MLAGKMVKIRFKKHFAEQRLWVFIGKVLDFTDNWVTVEGKGLVVFKGGTEPVDVDEETRILMVPRDNIAHLRFLPDTFDLSEIKVRAKGARTYVEVDGGPDTSIGE